MSNASNHAGNPQFPAGGAAPNPPEALQRAGGKDGAGLGPTDRNRMFFDLMMDQARCAAELTEWAMGPAGRDAPLAVRCAVMSAVITFRDRAAMYLEFLGGTAAAW
ncbi:uncharacterized protein E1O_19620 [Burkholderiales bacterium GJ-E10]|nr:uncharacterized protein E1O_19620 [Burkholderiales bacterium GJ-E10]